MLKLNLGSGKIELKGYDNIDLKNGQNAYPLRYESESVAEIRASHILEHFGRREVKEVLRNWVDKLRPGGVLRIAVPGLDKLQEVKKSGIKLSCSDDAYIMGGQIDENDFHKSIFTEPVLNTLLKEAGLQNIQVWKSEIDDCASLPVSLNLMGTKPGGLTTKIQAVMSMPRLGFTANMQAVASVFPAIGAGLKMGTGVFWGQVLSRLVELHRSDGTEYIVTCDYDTWFKKEHVLRLLQHMQENPEIDAIVPVQIKRENETPMFETITGDGYGVLNKSLMDIEEKLPQIISGHFGLTVFRVSAFDDLKKPWFIAKPNADGDWGEGRIDEDIYFWQNFYDCGKKACLATDVSIGHIQLMCTFPGPVKKQFKPVNYYMNQMNRGEFAEYCVPEVELLK